MFEVYLIPGEKSIRNRASSRTSTGWLKFPLDFFVNFPQNRSANIARCELRALHRDGVEMCVLCILVRFFSLSCVFCRSMCVSCDDRRDLRAARSTLPGTARARAQTRGRKKIQYVRLVVAYANAKSYAVILNITRRCMQTHPHSHTNISPHRYEISAPATTRPPPR